MGGWEDGRRRGGEEGRRGGGEEERRGGGEEGRMGGGEEGRGEGGGGSKMFMHVIICHLSAILVVVTCITAYFCSFWLADNEDDDVSATINDVFYWPILVSFWFNRC